MLDIKWIIDNQDQFKEALSHRGALVDLENLLRLYERKKLLQLEFDKLRAEQNQKSKEIGKLKKEKKEASEALKGMEAVAEQIRAIGPQQSQIEEELQNELLSIPNIPHKSTPLGKNENDNLEVLQWGEKPDFDFETKEHWEIGENLGILDFERAAKITGARFTLYKKAGALLERALINLMLDTHTQEHQYDEVIPPFMVNSDSLIGTGQLPKFEKDLFKADNYYLIPTAEVPVTNIYRDEILKEEELPLKHCAYTPCFRSEAGSHGKDVKGLIRQHQFNKVELVQFVHPDQSYEALEALTQNAETILQKLGLHYRKVVLSTGDLGFSSAKTYDLEVWLPGQKAYREISSCSNFEDYQARRAKIRFKDQQSKKNRFVHTLNGSGLAVGRTVVAILENYQNKDGSVRIPNILKPYMNGIETITKL